MVGRADIMLQLEIRDDPDWMHHRKMPHYGTFNANPLSAAAGIATLQQIRDGDANRKANEAAARLRQQMNEVLDRAGVDWCVYGEFSAVRLLLGHGQWGIPASEFNVYEHDYRKLKKGSDPRLVQLVRAGLLLNGVDMPGVGGLTMAVHTDEDIAKTVEAWERTVEWVKHS